MSSQFAHTTTTNKSLYDFLSYLNYYLSRGEKKKLRVECLQACFTIKYTSLVVHID